MTLDDLKHDFEVLDAEMKEFYEDNVEVIGKYRELQTALHDAINAYELEARRVAMSDSKTKGIVKVGPFEYMRKNRTEINPVQFLHTPEGRKAAQLGLFRVHQEFVEMDPKNIEDFMGDSEVKVILDERKLKDLDKAGELKIPVECVTITPMTPALQKGPRLEDY